MAQGNTPHTSVDIHWVVITIAATLLVSFALPAAAVQVDSPNAELYNTGLEPCEIPPPTRISLGLFRSIPSAPARLYKHDLLCLGLLQRPLLADDPNCEAKSLDEVFGSGLATQLQDQGSLAGIDQVSGVGHMSTIALKNRFCTKHVAYKRKDVFAEDHDVPAGFVSLWPKKYIQGTWERNPTFLLGMRRGEGLDVILSLNLEAADLWTEMMKCTDGDAEKARRQYFDANWTCGYNLKYRIGMFIANVRNAFSTAKYFRPTLKVRSRFELMMEMERTNRRNIVTLREPLPPLHPLFMQAMIQNQLEVIPMGNTKSLDDVSAELMEDSTGTGEAEMSPLARRFTAINQIYKMLPEDVCASFGLWPIANLAVQQAVHLRTFEMIVTSSIFKAKGKIRDAGFIGTNCNQRRLPDMYVENQMHIALDVRGINERYGVSTIPNYARAEGRFAGARVPSKGKGYGAAVENNKDGNNSTASGSGELSSTSPTSEGSL